MAEEPEQSFDDIEASFKKATAALRDAGVPFLLGGGLAIWARGGPESRHDLDFMVKPEDAERALEALVAAGMRPERPPEEWLLKAWDGDVPIDLIFGPRGLEMTDEVLERGEDHELLAIGVRVMALEDVLSTKLLSLDEHHLDYTGLLKTARALREQIDWPALRARTEHHPYAQGFFAVAEALGIAETGPPSPAGEPAAGRRTTVRVVEGGADRA